MPSFGGGASSLEAVEQGSGGVGRNDVEVPSGVDSAEEIWVKRPRASK